MLESKMTMEEYEEKFGKINGQKIGESEISEESSLDSEEKDILKDDGLETSSKSKPKRPRRIALEESKDGDKDSIIGFNQHNLFGPTNNKLPHSQK